MKLFIGTKNLAKQTEHKRVLSKLAQEVKLKLVLIFPQDIGIINEPLETGQTLAENSLIKAKYYFKKSGVPTIADDGGFEIDALGGAPGIQAKYWAGEDGNDQKIIQKTLEKLQEYKTKKNRTARLKICLTFFDGQKIIQEEASIEGYIANKPTKNIQKGFPYRALLIISGINKYYDELSVEEHALYNHREKALKNLFKKIVV